MKFEQWYQELAALLKKEGFEEPDWDVAHEEYRQGLSVKDAAEIFAFHQISWNDDEDEFYES